MAIQMDSLVSRKVGVLLPLHQIVHTITATESNANAGDYLPPLQLSYDTILFNQSTPANGNERDEGPKISSIKAKEFLRL